MNFVKICAILMVLMIHAMISYKEVKNILHGEGTVEAHGRRHAITANPDSEARIVYIPPCVSVHDLHEQASAKCLELGHTQKSLPSLSTLFLQFVPSNLTRKVVTQHSGKLDIVRGLTSSIGRNMHP